MNGERDSERGTRKSAQRSKRQQLRAEAIRVYEQGKRDNGIAVLQSLTEAESVHTLARQADDPFSIGYCAIGIVYCLIRLRRFPEAKELLENARICLDKIGDRKGGAEILCLLGNILYLQDGRYEEALESYTASARLCAEFEDPLVNSRIQLGIGSCYLMLGDPSAALAPFLESSETLERCEAFEQLLQTYMHIAMLYMHIRDNDRTLAEYRKALALARQIGDKGTEAKALGEIGLIHKRLGELDKALEKFEESRRIVEQLDDTRYLQELLSYFAMVYDNQGKHDKALEYVMEALREISPQNSPRLYVTCMIIAGNVYARQNNPREAIRYYEQARDDTKDLSYPWDRRFICLNLAECYECIGDTERALTEFKAYIAIVDELTGQDQDAKIRQLQRRFQEERARRDLQVQEERSARLRQESSQRTKDLTTVTLQLVRKYEFLDQVQTRLQAAAMSAQPEMKERLLKLVGTVRNHTADTNEWSLFEEYFHKVHPNFSTDLQERCVSLTEKELKVCVLLKIGLSSKEIANILCASLRSIETYRFRIRKKLNLSEQDNLATYIVSL